MYLTKLAPLVLPLAVLALAGCETDHSVPGGSTVKILSTSPDHTKPLRQGDTVQLRAEVEYLLNVDSGTLSLIVQKSDASSVFSHTEVVASGKGTSILEAEFVVPDTKAVMIFTSLNAQGQTTTSTVDTLAFKVETDVSDLGAPTLIAPEYCAISGVTVDSSVDDVLATFGQPNSQTEYPNETHVSAPAGRSFDYDGIFVGLKGDSVILVSSDSAEHGLSGGIRPTLSRDDVVRVLGETDGMTGNGREVLAYQCRDIETTYGDVMVAVVVEGGLVESVSVVVDDGD